MILQSEQGDVTANVSFDVSVVSHPVMSLAGFQDQGFESHFSKEGNWMSKDGRWVDIRRKGKTFVIRVKRRRQMPKVPVQPFVIAAQVDQMYDDFDQDAEENIAEAARVARRGRELPAETLDGAGDVPNALAQGPVEARAPQKPSDADVRLHELTHAKYESWCAQCVSGRGRENHHIPTTKDVIPEKEAIDRWILCSRRAWASSARRHPSL